MVPRGGGFLVHMIDPETLPPWLTAADIEFYAGEFGRTGFRGGLNWYRNIDRNWELLAPFAGAVVNVPALYVAGDRDLVVRFPGWISSSRISRGSCPSFGGRSCCRGAGIGRSRSERARSTTPCSSSSKGLIGSRSDADRRGDAASASVEDRTETEIHV